MPLLTQQVNFAIEEKRVLAKFVVVIFIIFPLSTWVCENFYVRES